MQKICKKYYIFFYQKLQSVIKNINFDQAGIHYFFAQLYRIFVIKLCNAFLCYDVAICQVTPAAQPDLLDPRVNRSYQQQPLQEAQNQL